MKKDELGRYLASSPNIQELRRTAKMLGLNLKRRMKKRDIIKLIKEYTEGLAVASSNIEEKPVEPKEITSQPLDTDLPNTYNKDRLVLAPVNPKYVFCRWDFSKDTIDTFSSLEKRPVLRLHDVTNIFFDGTNANKTEVITIDPKAGNWYFKVAFSGADYLAEIGYFQESFIPVMSSNMIKTPRDFPVFESEEKWFDIEKKKITLKEPVHLVAEEEKIGEVSEMSPSSEEYLISLSESISGGRRI